MNWELVASAAVGGLVGSVVTALINGWVTYTVKIAELEQQGTLERARIKEGCIQMAAELAKMKDAQLLEAVRLSDQPATPWDPAVALSDYLAALDEIDRTGRWSRGDAAHDAFRSVPRG